MIYSLIAEQDNHSEIHMKHFKVHIKYHLIVSFLNGQRRKTMAINYVNMRKQRQSDGR